MEAILHGSTEDVSIIEKSVERERESERERERERERRNYSGNHFQQIKEILFYLFQTNECGEQKSTWFPFVVLYLIFCK